VKPLPKPAFTTAGVYSTCISTVTDPTEKQNYMAIGSEVAAAAAVFDQAIQSLNMHNMPKATPVAAPVSDTMLKALYIYRMLHKRNTAARAIYDAMIASAPGGLCPLCSVGFASTLDHYAPKSAHPMLAVVPLNLVPACGDCNRGKLASLPSSPNDHTLHPYYDDVDTVTWLIADVLQTAPASFNFKVVPPVGWGAPLSARVQHHFNSFGLSSKLAAYAANELSGVRYSLDGILSRGGPVEVQAHLAEQAASWSAGARNSWQAAMYSAAAGDSWFCSGGFR
jgi:hypothetical protein